MTNMGIIGCGQWGPNHLRNFSHLSNSRVLEFQLLAKEGDITIPRVDPSEPLKVQDSYFIDCVEHKKHPEMADGSKALQVIKTLVAIQESIDKKGAPVSVK